MWRRLLKCQTVWSAVAVLATAADTKMKSARNIIERAGSALAPAGYFARQAASSA
jgi:hypothetical protein